MSLGWTHCYLGYVALTEWVGLPSHTWIFSQIKVEGWKHIAKAVHAKSAKMLLLPREGEMIHLWPLIVNGAAAPALAAGMLSVPGAIPVVNILTSAFG